MSNSVWNLTSSKLNSCSSPNLPSPGIFSSVPCLGEWPRLLSCFGVTLSASSSASSQNLLARSFGFIVWTHSDLTTFTFSSYGGSSCHDISWETYVALTESGRPLLPPCSSHSTWKTVSHPGHPGRASLSHVEENTVSETLRPHLPRFPLSAFLLPLPSAWVAIFASLEHPTYHSHIDNVFISYLFIFCLPGIQLCSPFNSGNLNVD